MATTIQTIELPKKARALDTSGNNNHGQIYSGRGLEFDGVADSLTVTSDVDTIMPHMIVDGTFTVACWIKQNSSKDQTAWYASYTNGNSRVGLGFGDNGEVSFTKYNGSYTHKSNTATGEPALSINTWYRAVCVMTSGTQKLYINGVEVTGIGTGDTNKLASTISDKFVIGERSSVYFDGAISDFQSWDAAWTAADVTYDYLNPESLALNGGGTALTESNLKLWYPMQDGHRGQQSYILDGANAGLGDEKDIGGNFPLPNTHWSLSGFTIADNKLHCVTDGTYTYAYQSNVFEIGKTYKVTFDITGWTSGNIRVRPSGQSPFELYSADGSYTQYVTATHGLLAIERNSACDMYLGNLVVKPVNAKNHATTVFYGDDISDVAQGTFVNGSITGWTLQPTIGATASNTTDGAADYADITSSGSSNELIQTTSNFTTVVGRTYRVTFDRVTGTGISRCYVNTSVETLSGDSSTAGTYTFDFVATATGHKVGFRANTSSVRCFIDNVKVNEVGVASGWTDADQQLHIPQPALQSYNELAWFEGSDESVVISHDNLFSFGDGSDDSVFSVSAWVFMNEAEDFIVIGKGIAGSTHEWLMYTDSNGKLAFYAYDESTNGYVGRLYNTALTSYEGSWIHLVGTYDASEANSGFNIYLNGQQIDDTDFSSGSYTAMENLSTAVTIGRYYNTYSKGSVTEASIWSTELSQAEVNELYNDGKALDATTHSESSNLVGYWRNNGLSTWTNLDNPGTLDGTPTNITETILIPAGVDSTRDNQGFIMNKQKDTSCLNLDGIGYVSLPTTSVVTDDFSFEAWAKAEYVTGGESVIMEVGASMLLFGGDHAYIRAVDGTFTNQLPTHSFVLGNWYHIVVTRIRNGNQIMYVDGVAKNTVTAPDTAMTLSDTTIGKDNTTRVSRDALDGVKIYSKALSEAEVLRNYNATKGSHRN